MKRSTAMWVCALMVLSSLLVLPSGTGADEGGSAQRAPTLIYNVNDLQNMSNNLVGDYALANDINATATSGWNGGAGFKPVGNTGSYFNGIFDGRGYNITGLYISLPGSDAVGLFGVAGSSAKIKNVNLLNVRITGYVEVGGLVGYAYYCQISSCNVSGTVSGNYNAGGLIGNEEDATVTACSSTGSVNGLQGIGGLIGQMFFGTASYCYSTASVTGEYNVGGLIGVGVYEYIYSSYSTGQVSGRYDYTGGLIGYSIYGTLEDCYSTGQVSGMNDVGGLLGYSEEEVHYYCYATGAVRGNNNVGGLIGLCRYDVIYCSYGTGSVTGTGSVGGLVGYISNSNLYFSYSTGFVKGSSNVGGLIGLYSNCYIYSCYWDTQASGMSYSPGGTGKTTDEMMTQAIFTDWDFTNTWGIFEKTTYPYMRWRYPSAVLLSGIAYRDGGSDRLGSGVFITVVDNFGYSVAHFETRTDYTGQYRQIVDKGTVLAASWDKWAKGTSYGKEMGAQSYSLDIYNRTIFAKSNIGKNISVNEMVAAYGKYRSGLISPLELSDKGLAFETGYSLVTAGGTVFETDRNLTVRGGTDMRFGGKLAQAASVLLTASNITIGGGPETARDLALNCTGDIALLGAASVGNLTIINARYCIIQDVLSAMRFTQLAGTGVTDFTRGQLAVGLGEVNITTHGVIGRISAASLSLGTDTADLNGYVNGLSGQAGADQIKLLNAIGLESHYFDGINLYKFTPKDVTVATEDALYSVDYEPMFPSATITWSLETEAGWLQMNTTTGVLSGTPGNSDVGLYRVEVTAHEEINKLSREFMLEVVNVNDPPVILTQDDKTAVEDESYSVIYDATDIDPTRDVLVWSLETNASWLKLDMNRLWGNPANDDVGQYWVKVTVSDGHGGTDSTNFTLTVDNVNDLPVITTPPPSIAVEDSEFNFTFAAEDQDADEELTWALDTTAGWLSIDAGSGLLSGTPSNGDVGSAWVKVTVTDHEGATASVGFMLTIKNTNDPPVWVTVPGDQNITEGDELYLDAMATDVDLGDVIRYSISTDPASGPTINPATGTIRWPVAVPGNYTVTLTASDGKATNTTTFKITVNKLPPPVVPPANNPPRISAPTVTPAKVGQAFTCKLNGSDADAWDTSNLTFRLVSGPAGMMVSADGNILWIPTKDQTGSHVVVVSLTDGKNTTTTTFTVEAKKPGVAPASAAGGYNEGWLVAMLFLGLFIGALVMLLMGRRPPKAEAAPAPLATFAAPATPSPMAFPEPAPPAPMPAIPPPEQPRATPPPPEPAPAAVKPPEPARDFKP